MTGIGKEEIRALGKAAGMEINEPELTAVECNLNAILDAMGDIDTPSLRGQEPLPIVMPREGRDG